MADEPPTDPLTEGLYPIDQLGPNEFQSRYRPESASFDPTQQSIGFGGQSIGFSISVAYATISEQYSLYALYGTFLSASTTSQRLRATVTNLRDTRNFATRRVDVFQNINGPTRMIMTVTLDFHVPDPSPVLTYSASATEGYPAPEESWSEDDISAYASKQGAPSAVIKMHDNPLVMAARRRRFEVRGPPNNIGAQTLTGMWPFLPTTSDHLSITEKSVAYYWRAIQQLKSRSEHAAALAWIFDGGAGAVPPGFARLDFRKLSSMASLDFCLRVFGADVDVNRWLLREEKTVVAGDGRTFQEARIWDHASGRMVASCSQQCILRKKERL